MINRTMDRLKGAFRRGASGRTEGRYCVDTFTTLEGMREWDEADIIFDVGANDGRSILRWRQHLPHTRIVAFEPVRETFATLQRNIADEADVTAFNYALGAEPGRRAIFLHDLSALNSFHAESSGSRKEIVDIDTVDAVMAREKIDFVRLMKIDAEGHDLEVLKGAGRALRERRIDIVQVEAGFDAPGSHMPSLYDMQRYLAGFGYHLFEITNQCHGRVGGASAGSPGTGSGDEVLIYCDALFVSTGCVG